MQKGEGDLGGHLGILPTLPFSQASHRNIALLKNELLNSHEYFNFLSFSTTALTSWHYLITLSDWSNAHLYSVPVSSFKISVLELFPAI